MTNAQILAELSELDAKRVAGILSLQNLLFLVALDKHWPTIKKLLSDNAS